MDINLSYRMSLAALLIGFAALVFSLDMWSKAHPLHSRGPLATQDSLEFADRFLVDDTGAAIPAVTKYLEFVAESGSQGGLIHNYINQGLRQLTLALQGIEGLNLRVSTVDRMQRALAVYDDSLQAHPRWALDPARVRPAMLIIVEIMGSLNLRYDGAARASIKKAGQAALEIDSDRSTLSQRAKIQDFFIFSGQAVVCLKQRALAGIGGTESNGTHGAKPPPPL